jgi:hypothetical protein
MAIIDVIQRGIEFTNNDQNAKEMMSDFKDHKVGLKLDNEELTLVIKDGIISPEHGILDDCHVAMKFKTADLCGVIDNSYDLMEMREKGELLKGDITDPNFAVHFMAIFPFFDAMVRLYESDPEFKKQVDEVSSSL